MGRFLVNPLGVIFAKGTQRICNFSFKTSCCAHDCALLTCLLFDVIGIVRSLGSEPLGYYGIRWYLLSGDGAESGEFLSIIQVASSVRKRMKCSFSGRQCDKTLLERLPIDGTFVKTNDISNSRIMIVVDSKRGVFNAY